jgi:hypothetical protein
MVAMRPGGIGFDKVRIALAAQQMPEDTLRRWRATDIAHANKEYPHGSFTVHNCLIS